MIDDIIRMIEAEPEYPDPCPELRKVLAEAFETEDAQLFVLELCRHVVRQTKQELAAKVASMKVAAATSEPRIEKQAEDSVPE